MTALNLIRLPIATDALARWAGDRGWVRRKGVASTFDEGRALHHLLDECFGPGELRPFRMLVPPRRNKGNLYAYSKADAEALRASVAAHALPDHLGVLCPEQLECKPMPDAWPIRKEVGFDVRVRPVRRLGRDLQSATGTIRSGREVDAFLLEALRQHPSDPNGMRDGKRSREDVYLDWLEEQLAPSATLVRRASRLVRFRRVTVARSNGGPEGPDATIHGALAVSDPGTFLQLLSRGVGRHRAYGYGMLLLRPPNRPVPKR